MSVEIPAELQPQVASAIARGDYANEQELVSDILRITLPVLDQYQQMRQAVKDSVDEADRGELRNADFAGLRQRILQDYDQSGKRQLSW
ncbi:MAG: hypothetical protein ACTHK7_20205 [Aureliella sp.]